MIARILKLMYLYIFELFSIMHLDKFSYYNLLANTQNNSTLFIIYFVRLYS